MPKEITSFVLLSLLLYFIETKENKLCMRSNRFHFTICRAPSASLQWKPLEDQLARSVLFTTLKWLSNKWPVYFVLNGFD